MCVQYDCSYSLHLAYVHVVCACGVCACGVWRVCGVCVWYVCMVSNVGARRSMCAYG